MVSDLADGSTSFRVDLETKEEEVESVGGPSTLGFADAAFDGGCGVWEGALTTEEDGEQDAERPDLSVRCAIWLALKDLGTGERHGAEEAVEVRLRLADVGDDGRAEVDELDIEVGVNDTVFVLDVAVADADAVKVPDGLDDLSKHPACLFFCETGVLLDAFEEIAAGAALHGGWSELFAGHNRLRRSRLPGCTVKLHNEVKEVAVIEEIDELDHTGVVNDLEHKGLHGDDAELGVTDPTMGGHLVLEDELDSDGKSVGVALCSDDKAETTAAELIAKRVRRSEPWVQLVIGQVTSRDSLGRRQGSAEGLLHSRCLECRARREQ